MRPLPSDRPITLLLRLARPSEGLEVTSNRARTDAHAFYERLGYVATSFRFAKTSSSTKLFGVGAPSTGAPSGAILISWT